MCANGMRLEKVMSARGKSLAKCLAMADNKEETFKKLGLSYDKCQ